MMASVRGGALSTRSLDAGVTRLQKGRAMLCMTRTERIACFLAGDISTRTLGATTDVIDAWPSLSHEYADAPAVVYGFSARSGTIGGALTSVWACMRH